MICTSGIDLLISGDRARLSTNQVARCENFSSEDSGSRCHWAETSSTRSAN